MADTYIAFAPTRTEQAIVMLADLFNIAKTELVEIGFVSVGSMTGVQAQKSDIRQVRASSAKVI